MSSLSVDTRQKQPTIDPKNEEIIRQAMAQTLYDKGDSMIKNPADYFHEQPDKRGPYASRAKPTSIPLTSRCHPQEVREHSIVRVYDNAESLGYNTLSMLKCREHSQLAKAHKDYERACILNSRTIGLSLDISAHPDYEERFKAKGMQNLERVREAAIQEAAGLARVINARFCERAKLAAQQANPEPVPPERSLHDVWVDLGRSWRAVKSSITRPESVTTPPDLVVQNLRMDQEEYVAPRPVVSQPPPRTQPHISRSSSPMERPESRLGRRSSISKFDKDLPPPPKKQAEAEHYSFSVEYTESPSSTAPAHSWEDQDEEDDLPTYGDVLLEAYTDDPNPPALVRALRSGQVTDENLGLLSGRNSSMTSLLSDWSTGETQFHSAASSAPPSPDRDDGNLRSRRPSLHGKKSNENVLGQGAQAGRHPQEKQRSLTEKERLQLVESQRQFQRDLDAALRHLQNITKTRDSLPREERQVFNDETKSRVKLMSDLVNQS